MVVGELIADKRPPLRESATGQEIDTWAGRIRVGLGKAIGTLWTEFQMPVKLFVAAVLAFYTWQYTQQTPTPTPLQVQVQSMPAPGAAPSAPVP